MLQSVAITIAHDRAVPTVVLKRGRAATVTGRASGWQGGRQMLSLASHREDAGDIFRVEATSLKCAGTAKQETDDHVLSSAPYQRREDAVSQLTPHAGLRKFDVP